MGSMAGADVLPFGKQREREQVGLSRH
jgi:hypothetical protein